MATQAADELAPYVIKTLTELQTGDSKGSGSYGAVYRVKVNGFPCIAKRLHDILVGRNREAQVSAEGKTAIQGRFRKECILLSKLRHPNIVLFIGVHYGRNREDLTLVMEGLYTDLDKCLEKCMKEKRTVPLPLQLSILLDVAYGLLYLHSQKPPVIHRDLKASNILLTRDMRAKLADLGVSKILNLHPMNKTTQTMCPGTPGIMSPEALVENPNYDEKLDDFSFGTLVLHVANGEFAMSFEAPDARKGHIHIAKRKGAIDKMGIKHILYDLVIRCLQDKPERRPTTAEICATLERLCKEHPKKHFTDMLVMHEQIEMLEKEIYSLPQELDRAKSTIEDLRYELQQLQEQNAELQDKTEPNKAQAQVEQYKKEADQYREELEAYKQVHRDTVEAFSNGRDSLRKRVQSLDVELKRESNRREAFERRSAELESLIDRLQQETTSARQSQSDKLRGDSEQRLHDTLAATQKEKEALQNAVQVQGELRKLRQLKDNEEEAERESDRHDHLKQSVEKQEDLKKLRLQHESAFYQKTHSQEVQQHKSELEMKRKLEEKYEACQGELQQCKLELEKHQAQLENMEKLFQAQKISHSETQKELKETRQTLEGALKGSSDLHDEVLAKTQQAKQNKKKVDQYKTQLEELKAKLTHLEQHYQQEAQRLAAQSQSQQAVGQHEVEGLLQERDTLYAQIHDLTTRMGGGGQVPGVQSAQYEALRRKYDELVDKYDRLFRQNEHLQNLLKQHSIPYLPPPKQEQIIGAASDVLGAKIEQPQVVARSPEDPQQRQLGGGPTYHVRGPQGPPHAPQRLYPPTPEYQQPVILQYPHHPSPIYENESQIALQQRMQGHCDVLQSPQLSPDQHQQPLRMRAHSTDDLRYLQRAAMKASGSHSHPSRAHIQVPMHPPKIEIQHDLGPIYENQSQVAFHQRILQSLQLSTGQQQQEEACREQLQQPLKVRAYSDPHYLQPAGTCPDGSGHLRPSQAQLQGTRTNTPISRAASQVPVGSHPSSAQKPDIILPPKPVHDEAHQQIVASQVEVFPSQPLEVQQQGSSLELEIRQVAADVVENVQGKTITGEYIPFDPNLVCPHCSQQFRAGQIQKFKRHLNSCI